MLKAKLAISLEERGMAVKAKRAKGDSGPKRKKGAVSAQLELVPAGGGGVHTTRPRRAASKVVVAPEAVAAAESPVVVPVPESSPPGPAARAPKRRATAEQMAQKQREISISEFFTKNRHLLGFDNPSKALLTTIKEAVDNSLDACEEAGILPEITVEVRDLAWEASQDGDLTKGEGRFLVVVEDNGPGIVKAQAPKIFGKLLYGSKFHRLKQSRGQQGIGISAAGLYGQMTTGKPVIITSKTG